MRVAAWSCCAFGRRGTRVCTVTASHVIGTAGPRPEDSPCSASCLPPPRNAWQPPTCLLPVVGLFTCHRAGHTPFHTDTLTWARTRRVHSCASGVTARCCHRARLHHPEGPRRVCPPPRNGHLCVQVWQPRASSWKRPCAGTCGRAFSPLVRHRGAWPPDQTAQVRSGSLGAVLHSHRQRRSVPDCPRPCRALPVPHPARP